MENLLVFFQELAPNAITLVALILLDVVLGVAVALREKQFRWRELGDFYLTMVIPFLLGWLAFSAVSQFAIVELLGPEYGNVIGINIARFAWLAIIGVLGASIVRNGKKLYGVFPPEVK